MSGKVRMTYNDDVSTNRSLHIALSSLASDYPTRN